MDKYSTPTSASSQLHLTSKRYLVTVVTASWKQDDKQFFEDNKTRSFRLRAANRDEFEPLFTLKPTEFVLVRQHQPGLRERRVLTMLTSEKTIDYLASNDLALILLWEELEKGEKASDLGLLINRAKALAATTNAGELQS